MMKDFPFRLLGWMLLIFITSMMFTNMLVNIGLDFFQIEVSDLVRYEIYLGLSFISFLLSAAFSLLPLNKAIRYLRLLLNQPKTENIRVEDKFLDEDFKYGEWDDLSKLVEKVETKLRRRTKALLREKTELAAVMNSLASPTIAINSQLEVALLNSAFAMLFELSSDEFYKNRDVKMIEDIVSEQSIVDILTRAIKEEDFGKRVIPLQIKDTKRIFSIQMSPLRRGVDNSLYGVVASFGDETVKVELEQKRIDFVANASHELRTPIAAVSTSVSLLKKVDDPEIQKQVMESLELNSDRLVDLAQDLLDLSKIEDEVEVLEPQMHELQSLTENVIKGLSSSRKKDIEVSCKVASGAFDGSKVKQVLTNLLRNAIIYTPEDTSIKVLWDLNEEKDLMLTVKDSGSGVPKEEHHRVFERFYRVDKSRSRKSGGSGIGLSIVKHIMGLHDGEVSLEPYVEGEGATFICRFPQDSVRI